MDTLIPAARCVTNLVNARGETTVERLRDVPDRIREVALHGVRSGAADALAAVELREGLELSGTLSLSFLKERSYKGFKDLVEEFGPLAAAVADTSSADAIIHKTYEKCFSFCCNPKM